jgi:hypothetical protein
MQVEVAEEQEKPDKKGKKLKKEKKEEGESDATAHVCSCTLTYAHVCSRMLRRRERGDCRGS